MSSQRSCALTIRQRLCDEGLSEAQITRLEALFPTLEALLAPPAKMADVRDALQELQRKLKDADAELRRLSGARTKAISEARWRIAAAAPEPASDIPAARAAIAALSANVAIAVGGLRRRNVDTAEAVRLINRELWDGWGDKNSIAFDSDDPARFEARPGDPYPPAPSRSERTFRAIVRICFEAVVDRPKDPTDRAIRAYLKEEAGHRDRVIANAPWTRAHPNI